MINTMAMTEKSRPPADPTANENQKGSSLPSIKKGINPNTVDRMVSITAIILWLYARTYKRVRLLVCLRLTRLQVFWYSFTI